MTRPTARVLSLLEVLQAGGTRRVGDLAVQLGVDERTVRRYVGHLVDLGIPVTSVRGRYGGYHLAPGYRMPPLMLTDDEAAAALIGLVIADRAGLVPQPSASASALAKLRRVLPAPLRSRLEALLATASFTGEPRSPSRTGTTTLLTIAEGAHERRPVEIEYTDRHGRSTTRVVQAHGIVGHAGHWYVTGLDPARRQRRTFRLDRITRATALPGEFEAPEPVDQRALVLHSLAGTPWRHAISVRIRGDAETVGRRLPLSLSVTEPVPDDAAWLRVRIRAESLDWIPALLAGLDLPFVIEEPAELRERMREFAGRLREMTNEA